MMVANAVSCACFLCRGNGFVPRELNLRDHIHSVEVLDKPVWALTALPTALGARVRVV